MTLVGIGWYKRDQWDELRRVSVDREILEGTWEEWVALAEPRMIEMMRRGTNVQKVTVDIDDLVLWCRAQNRPVDAGARATYVTTHIK